MWLTASHAAPLAVVRLRSWVMVTLLRLLRLLWLRARLLLLPSLPLLRVIASALHRIRMHMPCTYLPTSACYYTNRCTNTIDACAVAVRGAVGEEVGAALALLHCSPALLLYYLPSLVCVAAAVSNVRCLCCYSCASTYAALTPLLLVVMAMEQSQYT